MEMWLGFTDFELAELAAQYGLQDELEFNNELRLSNRERIESLVANVELEMAFGDK